MSNKTERGYKLADGSFSGDYSIGDKFAVAEGVSPSSLCATLKRAPANVVLVFSRDDGSICPKFDLENGSDYCFEDWNLLKPFDGRPVQIELTKKQMAADEMYEMLQEMVEQFDYDGCSEYEYRLISSAKNLLAKATGE